MYWICKDDGVTQETSESAEDGCEHCTVLVAICATHCNYCDIAPGNIVISLPFFILHVNRSKNLKCYQIFFIFFWDFFCHSVCSPSSRTWSLLNGQNLSPMASMSFLDMGAKSWPKYGISLRSVLREDIRKTFYRFMTSFQISSF